MSAFLLSEQSMANLAETISRILICPDNYAMYSVQKLYSAFASCRTGKYGDFSTKLMGKLLFEMNDHALRQRYKDEWWLEDIDMETEYKDFRDGTNLWNNKYQFLKSLQCYLYQCSEGDTEEWELYKALDYLVGEIKSDIISNSEEYKKANWD